MAANAQFGPSRVGPTYVRPKTLDGPESNGGDLCSSEVMNQHTHIYPSPFTAVLNLPFLTWVDPRCPYSAATQRPVDVTMVLWKASIFAKPKFSNLYASFLPFLAALDCRIGAVLETAENMPAVARWHVYLLDSQVVQVRGYYDVFRTSTATISLLASLDQSVKVRNALQARALID